MEELYRNYGILADAKDSAGEVSIFCVDTLETASCTIAKGKVVSI